MFERRVRVSHERLHGTVLDWCGHFGWLAADEDIAHREAGKHGGKVYVSARDVKSGQLWPGARVSFFAYADGKGVGAEQVWMEAGGSSGSSAGKAGKWGKSSWKSLPRPSWSQGDHSWKAARGKGGWKGWSGDSLNGVQKPIDKRPPFGLKGKSKGKGKGKAPKPTTRQAAEDPTDDELVESEEDASTDADDLDLSEGDSKPSSAKSTGRGKSAVTQILAALGLGPKRDKSTHSGQDAVISWASSEMQGWRPAMEDAVCNLLSLPAPLEGLAMFAVFDGHGGAEVSRKVADQLPQVVADCAQDLIVNAGWTLPSLDESNEFYACTLKQAFVTLDGHLRREGDARGRPVNSPISIPCEVDNAFGLMGSTAVVVLMEFDDGRRPKRITVANCGDSRATICRAGLAVECTDDHKPENDTERLRIEAAGGHVGKVGPCYRVDGWGLNLSRAFGDFHYKNRSDLAPEAQKVSIEPDVTSFDITQDDEFLLLGCDGVYELHNWQQAIDQARQSLEAQDDLTKVVEDLVDASCSPNLMETAGAGGDNVSAMVIRLQ
eukprot:TRINITY_DN1479_c0_g1_i1.p1 TRINITY_DN1479_c0_g1~~TRINITY_DN1479_c0_g1_i1.p1  ORF type:complete len:549 (+),score=100.77 TRINITY_DN1479_c0_g1_i1:63-1709(+)